MNGIWKAVEIAVPVNMHPVHINSFIAAEVHILARRVGEAVADLRIGAPRDARGDFSTWSASYLPAPQTIAA
jgi:hypothetical protein